MSKLTITIGYAAESGSQKHPHMVNGWNGTKDIQETRKRMNEPDKGLCQKYDFRKTS